MQNRLGDIAKAGVPEAQLAIELPNDSESISESMQAFFEQNETAKSLIKNLGVLSSEIAKLEDIAINAVRSKDEKEASDALEKILSNGQKDCEKGKDLIAQMEADREALAAQSGTESEVRIRQNMEAVLRSNFVAAVREFQQAQTSYKDGIKAKVERQVKLVKPDATSEEIDKVMRSGDSGAIYRAAILKPGADPIEQAYADVQAKFKDVIRLEESVRSLNQMFKDMALLVERQGEMLDQIEVAVTGAGEYVEKGTDNLRGALRARKASRKKMLIIIAILVVVVAIILLVVFLQ